MVVRVGGWRGRVGGGSGWTWTRGAGNRSVYSCCVSSFFFFFFFSFYKNVTNKIPKIKSLPGPQPLVPQPPPPKKRPLGGGGGERGKKEKRKKTHFSVFFFLRRPKSL